MATNSKTQSISNCISADFQATGDNKEAPGRWSLCYDIEGKELSFSVNLNPPIGLMDASMNLSSTISPTGLNDMITYLYQVKNLIASGSNNNNG